MQVSQRKDILCWHKSAAGLESLSPHPDHPLSSVDTQISILPLCQSLKHCDCMAIVQGKTVRLMEELQTSKRA